MESQKVDVSVLIATFAREDLLEEVLASLECQELDGIGLQVLIGDNACREETSELCSVFSSRMDLTYVAVPARGKNNTLNALIPKAKGDICILTDDDIIAEPDWIKQFVHGAARYPETSLFGGRVLPNFAHGDDYPEHPLIQKYAHAGNWPDGEGPIAHHRIHGTNMAVRRQIFEDGARFNALVGPNGKNYMMGSETEFCLQLRYHGYSAVYLPEAIVHHHIRREQYDPDWWLQRMERRGRGAVLLKPTPDVARFLGVPRHFYKKLLVEWMQAVTAYFFGSHNDYISRRAEYLHTKGLVFQYRADFIS